MAMMGFNPAAEMSQLRTQQTLAMQASSAPAGTVAAAPAADPAAAAVAAAAVPGAAGDAAVGANAVQAPPSTSKIILQSVLKGALSGASMSVGLKSFGGPLMKIDFVKKFAGHLPTGKPPVGAGLLGFLGKIPVIGGLLGRGSLHAILATALIGAVVGGVIGAVTGAKKAKAAAAEYAEAAAAAAAAAQAPATPPVAAPASEPKPASSAPPVKPKYKSWVVARTGSTKKTGGSFGSYTTKSGDTLAKLAERFHTTPAEIKKLNPGLGDTVPAGKKLKLRRKVVPTATFYRG